MFKSFVPTVIVAMLLLSGSEVAKAEKMDIPTFIEIVVQNHMVSHGFDEKNQEILEEVTVEKPSKKLIRVDRIQSVSEKYILTSYGVDRLVYWEYEGSYDDLKQVLVRSQGK